MSRIALVAAALLLTAHALLTFVFAFAVFHGDRSERLVFAGHGFTFLVFALVNLLAWQQPARAGLLSGLVHAANVTFLAFCIAFAVTKPEPPAYVAAALMLVLTAAAIGSDRQLRRGAPASM